MKPGSFITDKIQTVEKLQAQLLCYKLLNKSIAFTNGCFDILHAGHIHSLTQAAFFADVLIVGVNSDASSDRCRGDLRRRRHARARGCRVAGGDG